MIVLVVGGGGREHAIIKKLKENDNIEAIYALPGNGGIAADADCVNIGATDIDGIVEFVKGHPVDFAVVAPDDPLAMGCVDRLEALGIKCFGPVKDAAIIEASKVFAKDLMRKYNIPTAQYETFTEMDKALAYLDKAPIPTVVKADGLALGKGVIIAETREDAKAAVRSMMEEKKFGDSGSRIVIEEFLTGPEVSVLSFTDGKTIVPMVSSQDHKRALDGDQGLNTGGMGTVAPNPYYTPEVAERCMKEIFLPTMEAMNAEGRTFKGCLYFGLMITEDGPKVIEYNCRFGDPETQVVLPLLESDLYTIMEAVADERLGEVDVKGFPMEIGEMDQNVDVFIAGAKAGQGEQEGQLLTSGGRVLGVTAVADTLEDAIRDAYANVNKITFEKAFYRTDIGQRALAAKKE